MEQPPKRFHCTATTPWKPEYGTPVVHEGTDNIGEQEDGWPGGDIITVKCRNCGHIWRQELPQ